MAEYPALFNFLLHISNLCCTALIYRFSTNDWRQDTEILFCEDVHCNCMPAVECIGKASTIRIPITEGPWRCERVGLLFVDVRACAHDYVPVLACACVQVRVRACTCVCVRTCT